MTIIVGPMNQLLRDEVLNQYNQDRRHRWCIFKALSPIQSPHESMHFQIRMMVVSCSEHELSSMLTAVFTFLNHFPIRKWHFNLSTPPFETTVHIQNMDKWPVDWLFD